MVILYVNAGTFELEIEKFSNSFLFLFWFVGTFGKVQTCPALAKTSKNFRSDKAEVDDDLIEESKIEAINQTGLSNLMARRDDHFLIGD